MPDPDRRPPGVSAFGRAVPSRILGQSAPAVEENSASSVAISVAIWRDCCPALVCYHGPFAVSGECFGQATRMDRENNASAMVLGRLLRAERERRGLS